MISLVHADGGMPNLALMRLSAWLKSRGEQVRLLRKLSDHRARDARPTRVYGSSIFQFSAPKRAAWDARLGPITWGGTGVRLDSSLLEIDEALTDAVRPDYTIYPECTCSIGFCTRGCRLKCGFCLTPESLVITNQGPKPIAAVVPGDLVLTHYGRYRRVTEVMFRHYKGDVIELRSGALSEIFPTTVTPDHLVRTRHISYRSGGQRLTSFTWMEAGKIPPRHPHRSGEAFVFPRPINEHGATPDAPGAPWLTLNADAMTLLGWFVAEGYVSSTLKRGYHRTTFCLGHTERERGHAAQIADAAARLGIRAHVGHPKIGIRVTIENVALARWLVTQFGTGAATKRLPFWIRTLPADLLTPFVAAWARGDGWEYLKKNTPTCKITTVSVALALGLHEILLKIGHVSTINRHQVSSVIQGRAVNTKPAFTVIYHPPRKTKRSITNDDVNVYRAVRTPVVRQYDGPVFNLEVEDDHSYCTPAFTVHNCVVPQKEGKPSEVALPLDIWRGEPWPRHIELLDNDAFAPALRDHWIEAVRQLREGRFRVCFSQGLNLRLITDEAASMLATLTYTDHSFDLKSRRLYTAWDNLGDEAIFRRGVATLGRAGIPPHRLTVYMLIGYRDRETWDEVFYRFAELRALGCNPFPMVYDKVARPDLAAFARWANGNAHGKVPWPFYTPNGQREKRLTPDAIAASDAAFARVAAGWKPPRRLSGSM